MTLRSAAFLDRDNTIVVDPGFLRVPDLVALLPGVSEAIRALNHAGIPVVVITNQSGIARGIISAEEYRAVTARMQALLALDGAHIDAIYYCPHLPEITGECECRKPGPELYRAAAHDLGLDLSTSWYVGDRMTDVLPAVTLGGQGILLRTGSAADGDAERSGILISDDLLDAVRRILDRCGAL